MWQTLAKQYDDTHRMQHNELIHIVLTIYTALCGLHKTAYAGLTEKQQNNYTCVHAYTSHRVMRKFYKNSMTITIKSSLSIIHNGAHII